MNRDTLQPDSLIKSLLDPKLYDPPVEKCDLIETHISWVILAGRYAYKIKKSIDLGFLDFSTLEKRHFFCDEELRLNRRLAPAIYLSVIPITGTVAHPRWGGDGKAIEYAIKMEAFPQEAQLDRALAAGALQPCQMDLLARLIATFHNQAEIAPPESRFGDPDLILEPIKENFKQIRERVKNANALQILTSLEDWSLTAHRDHQPLFRQRKAAGFVRECHGDLHLRNIAWVDDVPIVFDCIDFNSNLRWIDVISDIAFLVMDLQDRRQPELAHRFLNNYLENTGDYPAVGVLRFYQVYRAMVRAKIDAIRVDQAGLSEMEQVEAEQEFFDYLNLASGYVRPSKPRLILMRGMSASGKSTISGELVERLGAIRLRSDVERKRLFGLQPEDDGRAEVDEGIYSAQATEKTYLRLLELAEQIIAAGYSVIVDAVFLRFKERERFRKLADNGQAAFAVLECKTDARTLRQRIVNRRNDVSDACLKVLEMQSAKWQPLYDRERDHALTIDTTAPVDIRSLARQLGKIFSL